MSGQHGVEKKHSDSKAVLNRLKWLCSRREYCSGDILVKLRNSGIEGMEAHDLLKALQDGGYVDDIRYVSSFVRDKALISGWGEKKIAFALKSKGMSSEVIDSAIAEVMSDSEAVRKMQAVVKRKWQSLKNEDCRMRVAKTVRYAVGRGYDYGQVLKVVDCVRKQSE